MHMVARNMTCGQINTQHKTKCIDAVQTNVKISTIPKQSILKKNINKKEINKIHVQLNVRQKAFTIAKVETFQAD